MYILPGSLFDVRLHCSICICMYCLADAVINLPCSVELVEGLGVYLPAHVVLAAVRDSPTAFSLVRKLMGLLCVNTEMANALSRVRGSSQTWTRSHSKYFTCTCTWTLHYTCTIAVQNTQQLTDIAHSTVK